MKLEKIVKAMIDGGWEEDSSKIWGNRSGFTIKNNKVLFKCWYVDRPNRKRTYATYSLPDLLASPDAMKVFGEELYCVVAGKLYCTTCLLKTGYCGFCSRVPNGQALPAWKHHAHKALDIIWDEGEEKAIEYLYNQLKGEDDDTTNRK